MGQLRVDRWELRPVGKKRVDGPRDNPWTVHYNCKRWPSLPGAGLSMGPRIKAGRYVPEPPISEPVAVSEGRWHASLFSHAYDRKVKWEVGP